MKLSAKVEAALYACGRERIFSSDHPSPGIAIRFDGVKVEPPDDAKPVIERRASTHDEAGELAARAFADRLRDAGRKLFAWADRIESSLMGKIESAAPTVYEHERAERLRRSDLKRLSRIVRGYIERNGAPPLDATHHLLDLVDAMTRGDE